MTNFSFFLNSTDSNSLVCDYNQQVLLLRSSLFDKILLSLLVLLVVEMLLSVFYEKWKHNDLLFIFFDSLIYPKVFFVIMLIGMF